MVFLLIIIGTLLILLNVKAIKKEDNSFSAILRREESTENRDYDVEIISIRKDLAESILDIQKEMEEIKKSVQNVNNKENIINLSENVEEKDEMNDSINNDISRLVKDENQGVISEIDFTYKPKKLTKVDEVKILVKDGCTDDEICEKMSIGKGEVLLIKGLFKN